MGVTHTHCSTNKGVSNGGHQEEDAGHEGGEGQCYGPLRCV